jgi:DNA-binding XRE family transcriptional regulator
MSQAHKSVTIATPTGKPRAQDVVCLPLVEWRLVRGWTQDQLAAQVGITAATVRNIETGRVTASLDTAIRIAERLGCLVEQVAWNTKPQPKRGPREREREQEPTRTP